MSQMNHWIAGSGISKDKQRTLNLNERLSLIALIDEGMHSGASNSPIVADLFNNLWDLVSTTIAGSKINCLAPEDSSNGFRILELRGESGEELGYLNMIYLKKPIPCYYLVYVEVAPLFRKQGLGNRILQTFRDFLIEKSAVGILDNIIPREDLSYDIYFKHAWEPIESIIGDTLTDPGENYMVFVPPPFLKNDLRHPLYRLIHHLKRKRASIDMRDNQVMVRRTISEFQEIHRALITYFAQDLQKATSSPLMRFMFTRFATKFIAFRRRIGDLLGYTGGEALEQIVLDPTVSSLPLLSYAPSALSGRSLTIEEYEPLSEFLPQALKERPAHFIEALPNYQRPSLTTWLQKRDAGMPEGFTLGHLMELGFDPTRLKQWAIEGRPFIFERMQARQCREIRRKKQLIDRLRPCLPGMKALGTPLQCNPPLMTLLDRGNAYVLRRKIPGIHWEEALEQLQVSNSLAQLNRSLHLDRLIIRSLQRAREQVAEILGTENKSDPDIFAWFVSWNLERNRPVLNVDASGAFLESIWIA